MLDAVGTDERDVVDETAAEFDLVIGELEREIPEHDGVARWTCIRVAYCS